MKKTVARFGILAAGLTLILSSISNAQSFLEDFSGLPTTQMGQAGVEAVNLPSGTWQALNASSPLGLTGWFSSTEFTTTEGPHLAANFNATTGTNTINAFFMSPVLTFNNGDTISFITRNPSTTFPDRLRVLWSGNGASTAIGDFSTTLLSINEGLGPDYPIVWTQFDITVSGLAAPTSGRFAFNYNVTNGGPSGANSNLIGIDNVAYTAIPEPTSALALLGLCMGGVLRRRRS